MESDYEYEYSSADDSYGEMVSEDGEYEFDTHAEVETIAKKAPYVVYNEETLREKQQEAVSAVAGVLSISDSDVVRVLRHFKWDANRVNEEWFADEEEVRSKVGLPDEVPVASTSGKRQCQVCFDEFDVKAMRAAHCQHFFCKDCWRGYASNAISSGPSVLSLRCPLPDCSAAVPVEVIKEVVSKVDMERFETYAMRSFVEDNRQMTWCPSPGCEHAVEARVEVGADPLDINCKCGAAFCFQCKEEAHRPVNCETVHKWILKNSAESENLNWILAHTKQCPKCKRPIEKNQGCMHMTCSQCRFEFCWLCQGAWAEHGERTGGFYACNRYEAAKKKGEYDEETMKREHAKTALERYMHYYQRWAEHDRARISAYKAMQNVIEQKLEELSELIATPTSQLKFLLDAWAQVVDCRRILKWTYAYGFYRFTEDATYSNGTPIPADVLDQQKEFFEFNQGQAEMYLDKLHHMVEKQVGAFLDGSNETGNWGKFRENLIGLTDVTCSHFSKLVSELEKGLDSLLMAYGGDNMDTEEAAGPSAPQPPAAAAKKRQSRPSKKARAAASSRATGGAGNASSSARVDGDSDLDGDVWFCAACTFANSDLGATECLVCESARPQAS